MQAGTRKVMRSVVVVVGEEDMVGVVGWGAVYVVGGAG